MSLSKTWSGLGVCGFVQLQQDKSTKRRLEVVKDHTGNDCYYIINLDEMPSDWSVDDQADTTACWIVQRNLAGVSIGGASA